jgi:2-polyprenyl-3-methyl-5-hydroxy-6-metoxy-1,4-benzoquinol methylase
MYQNPRPGRPGDRDNAEFYYAQGYLTVAKQKEMQFREKFDEFLSHLETGTVLDVGCAMGQFMEEAMARGWKAVGIDVSSWACAYLKKHGFPDVYNCTLEEANFPDNMFDAVNLNHILEHVPSPSHFLNEVRRILKHGGIVLIEVPNEALFPYNYHMINMIKPGHLPKRKTAQNHLNLFTKRTLDIFMNRSHLTPLIMREEGFAAKSRIQTPLFTQKTILVRLGLIFSRLKIDTFLGLGRYIVAMGKKELS